MIKQADCKRRMGFKFTISVAFIAIFTDIVNSEQRFDGGEVVPPGQTLRAWDSPFNIKKDIIVMEEAELIIEPGVKMIFSPKTMIAVNGTLTARVRSYNAI